MTTDCHKYDCHNCDCHICDCHKCDFHKCNCQSNQIEVKPSKHYH